jgi:uncharacterized RDD family membrane protein YckC
MVGVMNAIAQASAAPVTGPKLDNRRVAAALVDLVIVAAGAAAVLLAGNALTGERSEVRGALGFVIIGWALYYFFATESAGGQTLGKKLMRLRVVRADGRPAGMAEIAVRTILRVVDNYLVGLIVMLATGERRQRVGDLAAGTIVVDATAGPVAPPAPAPVPDVADEVREDERAEPAPAATITLPARPARPKTVSDLEEPETRVEEPALEAEPVVEAEPVAEEPMAEPVVEAEPLAEEPVVEVEAEPAAEVEPAVEAREEELSSPLSPSLEELAQDVAAAHSTPEDEEIEPVEDAGSGDQPEEATDEPAGDEPVDDGPVNVKSVETVSAMELIMGAAEEDAAEQSGADFEQDSQGSAS